MKLWSAWPKLRLRVAFPSLIKSLIGLVKALPALVKAFPRLSKALILLLAASFFLSIHFLPYSSPQTINHLKQVWKSFKKLHEGKHDYEYSDN